MENQELKTANQLYKESGTTLSFKEWVEREKAKGTEMRNAQIEEALERLRDGLLPEEETTSTKTFYGLDRRVWIFGAVVIGGAIAYTIYKSRKNG
jgi:hypothetical protein